MLTLSITEQLQPFVAKTLLKTAVYTLTETVRI